MPTTRPHAALFRSLPALQLLLMAALAGAEAPSTSTVTVSPDGAAASISMAGPGQPAFAPARVIVRFRAGASTLPGSGRSVVLSHEDNLHLVDNPPGLSVAQAIGRYRLNPNVVYAEPDYTVSVTDTIPAEPGWSGQWDMTRISAPQAWDLHKFSGGVVVAIVDTGIDFTHPDLAANLYTDGSSNHGYTCMGGSCVPGGFDDHGHGTHVAGTIGAVGNNGVGIAGINWSIQLLAIKFLGSGGSGSVSDAVLGFNQLKTLKAGGVNIRVTNNSWGGGGFSQALKDAMDALETSTPSTLNVCAAGNSGVNADFSPMYPAAYGNRGIVSVLATDSLDAGASFTNYGLASVDIAAPGVNTLSTESTGTCSLCDPTGYRTLSGTSMASPHVAGVAAALLDIKPSLTAAEARDALLDPGSYDWMTNARAQSTSSGGRLNFYKAIANPKLASPWVLNNFPTVTVGPDVFTTAGGSVFFSSSVSDTDLDSLRTSIGRGPVSAGSAWLYGWQANKLFPAAVPFTAPSVARTAAMPYDTAAADNRGGGASGRSWAVVAPVASPGGAPTGTLTVPATGTVNVPVTIGFVANDPEGKTVAWDLWASGSGGSNGSCCYEGTSTTRTFTSAGVYRISVQAIDAELNTSPPDYTAVISIGGATGTPPIARAALDKDSGPVPLTVNVDMRASSDPDGSISYYYIGCGGSFTAGSTAGTGSCTLTEPGTYWLLLQVQDNAGFMGLTSRYVVAYPAGGGSPPPDTTKPTVSITSPAAGSVTGTVSLQASASDNVGVKEVEYYLDSIGAASSLGTSKVAPSYTVAWIVGSAAPGGHTIIAVARDNANNESLPATVAVTVNVVLPTVSLAAASLTINRKGTLTLTATTNSPTYGIARVDFLVGTSVVCSDTSSPYSCTWKAPAAVKSYQAQAKAYDNNGNVGTSSILTVKVQ